MTQIAGINRRSLLSCIAATSMLPFITSSAYAQASAQKRGGTLRIAAWPGPTYLNTAVSTGGAETLLGAKMFDGLLDYDVGMVPAPALAESWDVSPDGRRIVFNLRKGVTWHDGQPFTSRDVQVTVMEILKVHHGRGRSTFANVTAVETPDEHTAIFVLSESSPAIFKALNASESPMMPAHLYAGTEIMKNPANVKPVGTGAFMLAEYTPGQSILMKRNPNYWDGDKPYIDQLVIQYVADAATRAAMLEAGEIDLVASSLIPPTEILRLDALPEFEVTRRGYEIAATMQLLDFNLRNPILAKPEVRKAFAHLIDRDWIVENIWFGLGYAGTGPLHTEQADFYTTDGVPTYPYDMKKAEALLDEAGYPRKSDGTRFALTIDVHPYGDEPLRASEYIREQCRQVGIVLNIRTADYGAFVKRIYTDRDFDLSNFVGSATADPSIGVHRFYLSTNIKDGVPWSNGSGYKNPEVDALLEAAATEVDVEKRKEQYAEFQRKVMEDVPTLPLCSTIRVTISRAAVRDHTLRGIGPFGTLADVWLDQ